MGTYCLVEEAAALVLPDVERVMQVAALLIPARDQGLLVRGCSALGCRVLAVSAGGGRPLGRGRVAAARVAALLAALLLLDLLHDHALAHAAARGRRRRPEAARQVLHRVLQAHRVRVHQRLVPAAHVGKGVDLVVTHVLLLLVENFARGAAVRGVEGARALHEEPVGVLVRLADDDVLLREAAVVPVRQVVRLRVLEVHRGMEQALVVLVRRGVAAGERLVDRAQACELVLLHLSIQRLHLGMRPAKVSVLARSGAGGRGHLLCTPAQQLARARRLVRHVLMMTGDRGGSLRAPVESHQVGGGVARTPRQLALVQDLLHGVVSGRRGGLVDHEGHRGWASAAGAVVIVAAGGHLRDGDHAKRVHEATLAAHVLVLGGPVRLHDQLLLVLHVRLMQAVVGLLRSRRFALVHCVHLASDDRPLEELLLGPLLYPVAARRQVDLVVIRREAAIDVLLHDHVRVLSMSAGLVRVLGGLLAVVMVLLRAPSLEGIVDELGDAVDLILLLSGADRGAVRRDDAAATRVSLGTADRVAHERRLQDLAPVESTLREGLVVNRRSLSANPRRQVGLLLLLLVEHLGRAALVAQIVCVVRMMQQGVVRVLLVLEAGGSWLLHRGEVLVVLD